jgi:hypothetical protein
MCWQTACTTRVASTMLGLPRVDVVAWWENLRDTKKQLLFDLEHDGTINQARPKARATTSKTRPFLKLKSNNTDLKQF